MGSVNDDIITLLNIYYFQSDHISDKNIVMYTHKLTNSNEVLLLQNLGAVTIRPLDLRRSINRSRRSIA